MLEENASFFLGIGFLCAGVKDFFVGTFAWVGIFTIIGVSCLYVYYQYKKNGE